MTQNLHVVADIASANGHTRSNRSRASVRPEAESQDHGSVSHLELARIIERISRRYLDLLRTELTRIGADDISPAQVMFLLSVGPSEVAVRDLIDRGYYFGSNASYNLKQLVDSGYLERTASARDRRIARIWLTEKGNELCARLRAAERDYESVGDADDQEASDLQTTFGTLRRLEQVWTDALRYRDL
jgi:DNA-binding MarR family transcriptional regulator